MVRGENDEIACNNRDTAKPYVPNRAEIEARLDKHAAKVLKSIAGQKQPELTAGFLLLPNLQLSLRQIGDQTMVDIPEERAEFLVALAETNPYAFDLASFIAGWNVLILAHSGEDPSLPLSIFGAKVLTGQVKRPPQRGRPRAANAKLRMAQYRLCRFVEATTSLRLTRNTEPGRRRSAETFTACDAVAEAFSRAGKHTTYANMKSLCYDAAFGDIREMIEYAEYKGFTEEGVFGSQE